MSLVLIRFQLASTAWTVTLKALPAVSAPGVPVLPKVLPGAAVSPGTSNCSLAKIPALAVTAELVSGAKPAWVTSLAVTVQLPTVLSVTLLVRAPGYQRDITGKAALASLEVVATMSLVLTRL